MSSGTLAPISAATEFETQAPMSPDSSDVNQLDMRAAEFFFLRCQELGIQLILVPREVAQAVPVGSSFYDKLAESGTLSGHRIREEKRDEMQSLWRQACEFDAIKTRFCDKYCDGLGLDRKAADPIWNLVTTMDAPHDPLALIACVPVLRDRFFRPVGHVVEATARAKALNEQDKAAVTKHLVTRAESVDAEHLREFMLSTLQTGMSLETVSLQHAAPLVVISDAGQDLDDEMALVLMRSLTDRGLVECKGSISTLAPSRARARLIKGTLNELGLGVVPVGIGTDGGFTRHTATFEETAREYLPDDTSFRALSGSELLFKVFSSAAPLSLEVLCNENAAPPIQYMTQHDTTGTNRDVFVVRYCVSHPLRTRRSSCAVTNSCSKRKLVLSPLWVVLCPSRTRTTTCCWCPTRWVGVTLRFFPFVCIDHGFELCAQAHNNQFSADSSAFFYRRCQELAIPMIIMSRHAAYVCPMPRSIYDDMAQTGHPVGKRLRETQRDSIEGLWKRACAPEGPDRLGLPARCDRQWFRSTFLDNNGGDRNGSDSIWDLVSSFIMYDPMALLAALPATRHFFRPTIKRVNGVAHQIIGRSPDDPGVRPERIDELQDFLYTAFFNGITIDFSEFVNTKATAMTSEELKARTDRVRKMKAEQSRSAGSTGSAGTVPPNTASNQVDNPRTSNPVATAKLTIDTSFGRTKVAPFSGP